MFAHCMLLFEFIYFKTDVMKQVIVNFDWKAQAFGIVSLQDQVMSVARFKVEALVFILTSWWK